MRNPKAGASFPSAFAHSVGTNRRVGLRVPAQRTQSHHLSAAETAIKADAINLERELGWRVGADKKIERLASSQARARTESFDSWTAVLGAALNPGSAQQPFASAGMLVLTANQIRTGALLALPLFG